MAHTIIVSEEVYAALQLQATRSRKPVDSLVETWLKQHLNLETFPGLEWRQGVGGWWVGLKGTAVDVYTIVSYSLIGYTIEEITNDLLPHISTQQARSALRYYAEYPDEIDQILAESEPEVVKAHLYRSLGPEGHLRLTGATEPPILIREAQAKYSPNEPD